MNWHHQMHVLPSMFHTCVLDGIGYHVEGSWLQIVPCTHAGLLLITLEIVTYGW